MQSEVLCGGRCLGFLYIRDSGLFERENDYAVRYFGIRGIVRLKIRFEKNTLQCKVFLFQRNVATVGRRPRSDKKYLGIRGILVLSYFILVKYSV